MVLIRGKKIGGKYLTPPGQDHRLYNSDSTWNADEVVVCEGEFDALVAGQFGYATVGLSGAGQWQDNWSDYLEGARKVYVVFDNDKAGHDGAVKVRESVGRKARIVQMPLPDDPVLSPGDNDISEHFGKRGHSADEFEALLRSVRTGLLLSVHDAYDQWQEIQGKDGLKFGYEHLDMLLQPGMMPGQVIVPLAKTNTGKTIHMLNIFQRMKMYKPDVNLFLSLEQTRGDWFERGKTHLGFLQHGCPFGDCESGDVEVLGKQLLHD